MAFKDAVLKKISIDHLVRKVRLTLSVEGKSIDRESMRALLGQSDYRPEKVRDLELFVREKTGEPLDVIVLDNGLDRYRTSLEDVALRKSPTIKEMISIRNARKILSDGDVLVSRKARTLEFVHDLLIKGLDLSWRTEEICALARDGSIRLEAMDTEGVDEDLAVFAEILGLVRVSAIWHHPGWWLYGKKHEDFFICLIAFSPADYRLLKVKGKFKGGVEEDSDAVLNILLGNRKADLYGSDVFADLARSFLEGGEAFYMEKRIP